MLPKMQQSHFVKKYSVQFVNAAGKLSAPFYFWDNKPHECSQTWQVRPERVRSDDAEQRARARRRAPTKACACVDVLFEGDRAVGVTIQTEGGARRDVRAKVVVDASGQNGLLQNRFHLRVWDPVLNKGAIWTYWKGAYRDTGRDEGATMVIQTREQERLVLVHPAARRPRQRRRRRAVRLPVQGPRRATSRPTRKKSSAARRQGAPRQRHAGDRLLCDQGLLVSLETGRRRRLGPRRRRVRLPRSALLVRRAAGASIRRDGRRRHRRGLGARAMSGRAARQVGPGLQRRRRSDAASGVRVLRRLQLRQLRAPLPDLKDGHRSADRRSLQRPGRQGLGADGVALPAGQDADSGVVRWRAGGNGPDQGNELFLPEGARP